MSWSTSRDAWAVQITVEGRRFSLGLYDDEVLAARAYDRKAWDLLGSEAFLNFPAEVKRRRRR